MTREERLEVVTRLHARGLSDGEVQRLTGIHSDQAWRDRRDLGLPAVDNVHTTNRRHTQEAS